MMTADRDRENRFLNEINRHLPDVDWKQGAVDYLRQLIHREGDHNEIYHLIKPFLGGPDFEPFYYEMYGFLNILHHIDLPMKSKVLDVACGPGWTSHFLAKLGYDALGIDISEDLIRIAKKRVSMDGLAPYKGIALTADFMVHDIEEFPLKINAQFECAFFENALHHFYNPVAVIRHLSENLRPEGILCIWEGTAPEPGSPVFARYMEIMNKYKTLERPYSRHQMEELLSICGYDYHEFYSQVNGLFNSRNENDMTLLNNQVASGDSWNICVASRRNDFFKRKSRMVAHFAPQPSPPPDRKPGRLDLLKVIGCAFVLRSQEKYVSTLYHLILNREPDASGLANYLARADSILFRLKLMRDFLNSEERQNVLRRSAGHPSS